MTEPLNADEEKFLQTRLQRDDIRERVEHFADGPLGQGVRWRRSQSYDHCYNYFAAAKDLEADLEKSCAVLGFYLASWGMFRGSSYLLKCTNSSDLAPVVHSIQRQRESLRAIDVDNYCEDNIKAVCNSYNDVKTALALGNHRPITLVTKVMAASFGCIPAFDRNFTRGFRLVLGTHAKLPYERLTITSLQLLRAFYFANQNAIDELHWESRTVAFADGAATDRHLTRAKIIDMYCFDLGSAPVQAAKV